MSGRLRMRAARLIRQLDAGSGYRDQIEREVTKRLERQEPRAHGGHAAAGAETAAVSSACAACGTANDADARFCKECGQKL
jgi:hypothetical protein